MRVGQLIKRYRITIAMIFVVYVLSYSVARSTRMLIHRVSYAGDTYYHSIDAGWAYAWSPLRFSVPINYIVFSPLRWSEALMWRFIPRDYEFH